MALHAKRNRQSVGWAELPNDILQSIFECLSFVEVVRAQFVCSNWRAVGMGMKSRRRKIPWLLLPPQETDEDKTKSSWFNLEEGRVYKINTPKEIGESCCVGSSHGFLILLDEKVNLFLLNPLTGYRIQLPPIATFFGIRKITKQIATNGGTCRYMINYIGGDSRIFLVLHDMVLKAILSSDPSQGSSYGVALIACWCPKPSSIRLAWCKGEDKSWIWVEGNYGYYDDIMCLGNQLYALSDQGSVEIWNLDGFCPIKMMDIKTDQDWFSKGNGLWSGVKFFTVRSYLVESCGKILVTDRYIDENIVEVDVKYKYFRNPIKSVQFHVSQLDVEERKWASVTSLDHLALFVGLGENQSVSVSALDFEGCNGNSIYFTDDDLGVMKSCIVNRGYNIIDMGVFNFEDKSIGLFSECNRKDIYPPPYWIIPNP